MATTLSEAIAQWRIDNPIGTITPPIDQSAYDAMASDRGAMMLARDQQQLADAARIALRKKYAAWQAEFAIPVTAGNTVVRLTNTRIALNGLIEILKDSGLVLDG